MVMGILTSIWQGEFIEQMELLRIDGKGRVVRPEAEEGAAWRYRDWRGTESRPIKVDKGVA